MSHNSLKRPHSTPNMVGRALIALGLISPVEALANPDGGTVVSGSASIGETAPKVLTIEQSSDRAIIDWRSFDIAIDEHTQFKQPGAQAITLNRVSSGEPSTILGGLSANGQVWLVNPQGILFGQSARVDVGGLLATTLDIDNSAFMDGAYEFSGGSNATVRNDGQITVREAGLAGLVAPNVVNNGVIEARLGHVQLSSASGFSLDLYGDGLINFMIDTPTSADSQTSMPTLVSNSGSVIADGGKVLLTADTAGRIVDQAINLDGVIRARSIGSWTGYVGLEGNNGAGLRVSGAIDVSGKGNGSSGGEARLIAEQTVFSANARIDASGAVRGGKAEVSGRSLLDYQGRVDLRGAAGANGTLLLDPHDLTIQAAGVTSTSSASGAGGVTNASNIDGSVLTVSTLQAQLALGNVLVVTGAGGTQPGNLTVASSLSWTGNSDLTLSAHNNIVVSNGATISNVGGGDLNLRADNNGSGTGVVVFNGGGGVNFAGSSGRVSLFYNPASFAAPTDYSASVIGGGLTSYMLINSAAQLQSVNTNLSGRYALGRNINASVLSSFTPIGNTGTPFNGVFDGQGHTISDLTIDSNLQYVGLFGDNNGAIRNVSLSGLDVDASHPSFVVVGGLVGYNQSSGTIESATVSGTVRGGGSNSVHVGGLVGDNYGTITRSSSSAAVVGGIGGGCCGMYTFGGLVGSNYGSIMQSSASGAVSGDMGDGGGLVGKNNGSIIQSFATGNVIGGTGAPGNGALIGGLVGWNQSGIISQSYARGSANGGAGQAGGVVELTDLGGSISQSYATGLVSGAFVGGMASRTGFGGSTSTDSYWDTQTSGTPLSFGATGLTTAQLKSALPAGFDPTVWEMDSSINDGYPHLRWQSAVAPALPPPAPVQLDLPRAPIGQLLRVEVDVPSWWEVMLEQAVGGLLDLFSGPRAGTAIGVAGTMVDVAESAVVVQAFLNKTEARNRSIMDDWLLGYGGIVDVSDAIDYLSNFSFMGVDNIGKLGVGKMTEAEHRAFLRTLIEERCRQLGLAYR